MKYAILSICILLAINTIAFAEDATFYVDNNLVDDCAVGAGTSYRPTATPPDCAGSDGTIAYNTMEEANAAV